MKKICRNLLIAIITSIIVMQNSSIVIANTSEQKQLENEQSETNSKIKETQENLEKVQNEKSQTLKQVEELSTQISQYENQINELDGKISDLNSKISEAEANIQKSEEDYKKQEELLNARLVAAYEAGETSYLDVLLSSENIVDLISNYYLVTEIATADTDLMKKIQEQKQEIEKAKQSLEASKQELATSKASKQGISTQLKATKQEKDNQVAQLSEDEKELANEIQELKSYESQISSKIKKMKEEYDRKQKELSQKNNSSSSGQSSSQTNGATSSYGFGWPVSNHSIGTGYGVAGKYWSSGYHTGVDFPVPQGTAVYAVGNGQVFDTGYNSAYGNFVEIYHGNNVYSFYAHASSVQVSAGQTVTKGQQIMLSGASGNVTGAHLHFEIRTPSYGYSSCVNPRNYLP